MLDIRLGTRVVLFYINYVHVVLCRLFSPRPCEKKELTLILFVDCGYGPPIRARWNTSHGLRRQ